MPEFYGSFTHISRIQFRCEAETEEEAKEKMLGAYPEGDHLYCDGELVGTVENVEEWQNIDEPARGNVRESCVSSFEIFEEED